jgi:phosphoglycolate phosphatase
MTKRIAALCEIDGTLIITGGAGAAAWRLAFEGLYGIPADIGEFTDTGMTDPDVGHRRSGRCWAATPAGPSSL